jgi:hypothetical protein
MDDLDEFPPIEYRRGDKSNPMFKQWHKVVRGCSDPSAPAWPQYGAKQISMTFEWFKFENFVRDMQDTFENDPAKPASLRCNYLDRKDKGQTGRKGFNKDNAIWVPKRVAIVLQPRTKYYDTFFGNGKTLRDIEAYLKLHEGEPFPDGREYKLRLREYDEVSGRMVTVTTIVDTITPIKLCELRRRLRLGKTGDALFAPVRPYGGAEDRIEARAMSNSDDRLKFDTAQAEQLGLTLSAYRARYDADGKKLPDPPAARSNLKTVEQLAGRHVVNLPPTQPDDGFDF